MHPLHSGGRRERGEGVTVRKPPSISVTELHAMQGDTKQHKFHAQKVAVDGITFDSKAEAARYIELCILQNAGKIDGLSCQVAYPFVFNGKVQFRYYADFVYFKRERMVRLQVVEDVKGVETPIFRLKKKLIEAQYGIKISVEKLDSRRVKNAMRMAGLRVGVAEGRAEPSS